MFGACPPRRGWRIARLRGLRAASGCGGPVSTAGPTTRLVDRGVVPQQPRRHAVPVPGQQARDFLLREPGEGAGIGQPCVAAEQIPVGSPDPEHFTAAGSAGHQPVTVARRGQAAAGHRTGGSQWLGRRQRSPAHTVPSRAASHTPAAHTPGPGLSHRGSGAPGALTAVSRCRSRRRFALVYQPPGCGLPWLAVRHRHGWL